MGYNRSLPGPDNITGYKCSPHEALVSTRIDPNDPGAAGAVAAMYLLIVLMA